GLPLVESVPLSPPPSREPNRIHAARPATAFQRGRWQEWCGSRRAAEKLYREAGEEDAGAAAALARFALERGDAASATRWAGRAQALDWHLPEAALAAALAARLDSRRHDALWQWERCLSYPETRRSGQIGLIDDALTEGLFRRAEERCGQLLAETDDLRVYGRLAHARRRLGHPLTPAALGELPNARLDPLLAAERRLADSSAPPLNATGKLAAAVLLASFGDDDAALRVLDDEVAPSPGTPAALLDYARAWIEEALPDPVEWDEGFAHGAAAVAVLRYAVDADPDDPTAAFQLGCALAAGGDWAGAETCWAAATDGLWGAEANRCLGLAAWHLHDDLPAAEAFFRHAVAAGGGARTLLEQDHLLARLRRHEERISILRAALDHPAGDTRVPLRLAAALLDAGRPEEMLSLLEQGSFQLYEGGTLPQVLWHQSHRALAERALKVGDPSAAAGHYREAARYPEHLGVGAPAANHLCETWYRCGAAHRLAGEATESRAAFTAGREPGYELVQETFPFNELLPEHGPPRLGTGWARNQLYRALCLRESGSAAAAETLLERIEGLAGELGCDDKVPAAIEAVRRGEEPSL
ncbi:MAG: hypothetical protein HYU66_06960, partial [Armatimonadetes bacterium]|nr:hypothetical protein [Armatimonadota bacterium]